MVVRPGEPEPEVFMVRRHQKMKFAADQFVFPGGTVREDDRLGEAEARRLGFDTSETRAVLASHDDPFAEHPDGGVSLWIAALRETFEEAGVLLAEEADGRPIDLAMPGRAARFQEQRVALQEGRLSLIELVQQERLRLLSDRVYYFSRWITPSTSPRRFDARFFVAELPEGQTAEHCQIESTDGLWITPREALGRQADGAFPMMFVTREHLKRLAELGPADELIEHARSKRIRVVRAEILETGEAYIPPETRGRW
jgi:8-oxo-dGTP pyrophosphatase MutT (NUDIX family)